MLVGRGRGRRGGYQGSGEGKEELLRKRTLSGSWQWERGEEGGQDANSVVGGEHCGEENMVAVVKGGKMLE